ncbi:UvrD-helicase domain-containing protein [Promicromonospora citrea]|uniref:RecBCD enzyme subunit RecB n=2 Tax=Promicromonospora citrea TaxID=43677 RepID=A0A8H9L758_9MICO|nr:UvrD-helicase domain-containing protein [Promicromonospora citrea]GGM43472.1 RecBCD enzyme subunit RecB [Promicromonospora citrea]
MDVFDLAGPLPRGTALLEASAGTGKTFAIGALVTRYVAEGVVPLEEMLVVTFGRAATQELRDRVRGALLRAERAFAAALSGGGTEGGTEGGTDEVDEVLAALLDVDDVERVVRHRRLADALASFDHATIATIHQFCQLVLRSLGVAGDTEPGAELVESLTDLTVEVVDDLYLRRYGNAPEPPPFDRACALMVATAAVEDPRAALADADPDDPVGSARVSFAREVRAEMERRKRRLGILSYDDLLGRLADALDPASADGGAAVRTRMRERWRVVLVDEFQDTDPVQWQVLDRAFGGAPDAADPAGDRATVLVGDPKQAIYAFRGGDVVAYLDAARHAATRATLGSNWRSDAPLVEALGVLLGNAALGHPEIVVRPVTAQGGTGRLAGAPHPAPFRLRQVLRAGLPTVRSGAVQVGAARRHVAADLAADVAGLLAAGATWDGRPLVAGDVAVLVSARAHGRVVQEALAERGVAAVMPGGDVFATPAADEWLTLLEALEAPHRSALVRAAALTPFLGRTAADLDAGGEDLTARDADTLRGWAHLVRHRGVAALLEAAEERGLGARVLARAQGERLLTDLRHLGQLLHEVSATESLGLTALLAWFRDERRRTGTAERPRRLDSDAAAVQVVTVHGSKGLQYPVVYLPYGYDNYARPVDIALYHDEHHDRPGTRTIDVSGSGAWWDAHCAAHRAEEDGEELRKLYVALTRAQSQVVAWWAPTSSTPTSGLHRLLFGRTPGTREVPDTQPLQDDDYVTRVLGLLQELGGPVAEVAEVAEVSAPAPADRDAPFAARTFGRTVDLAWRRTSYSGLIAAADDVPHVASEPETQGTDDEPDAPDDEAAAPGPVVQGSMVQGSMVQGTPSPMADLPTGAAFGSLVHAVLEHADPFAPDLRAELLEHVTEQLRWWPVPADPEAVADGLVPLHHTPLGPLADGRTLGEIGLPDRLRELTFELPLAGGDLGSGSAGHGAPGTGHEPRLRDLAPLLRAHLPADDPLAAYADRLEQPALGDQALRGYLTGSVDVVLRLPTGRFVVVDYKTNFLGPAVADYTADRMAEAMLHSHYPLQALLYGVVLHRYLRWRLPGYDPAEHLGGVLYLFVRGMAGPDTPDAGGSPAGVLSWRPPAELLVALSDLLAGAGDGTPSGARPGRGTAGEAA